MLENVRLFQKGRTKGSPVSVVISGDELGSPPDQHYCEMKIKKRENILNYGKYLTYKFVSIFNFFQYLLFMVSGKQYLSSFREISTYNPQFTQVEISLCFQYFLFFINLSTRVSIAFKIWTKRAERENLLLELYSAFMKKIRQIGN